MSIANDRFAAALASVLILAAGAGGARAGLPGPTVNGDVSLSAAAYTVALTAPGTKYLEPPIFVPPGGSVSAACDFAGYCNYGTGVISAILGPDPSVLLGAIPANGGGGDSYLNVTYDVEYQDNNAPPGATINAVVHASDSIVRSGLSAAQATMTVSGVNGQVYLGYNCSADPGAAFGCSGTLPNAPFADAPVTLVDNSIYQISLGLQIYASGPVQVGIDPYFTAPANGGGQFIFSPGVTAGVPEPAAWALTLFGFAGLGAARRSIRAGSARQPLTLESITEARNHC